MFYPSIQELTERTTKFLEKKWSGIIAKLPQEFGDAKVFIRLAKTEYDVNKPEAYLKYIYVHVDADYVSVPLFDLEQFIKHAVTARIPAYLLAISEDAVRIVNITTHANASQVVWNGVEPVARWKLEDFPILK